MEKINSTFTKDIAKLLEELDKLVGVKVKEESGTDLKSLLPPEETGHVLPEPDSQLNGYILDGELSTDAPISLPVLVRQQNRDNAFRGGNTSFKYVRGMVERWQGNLNVAILYFEQCYGLALKAKSAEYIGKAVVQLATSHFERYRLHNSSADYEMAVRYSDILMEIGITEKPIIGRTEPAGIP